jgi:glucokinase
MQSHIASGVIAGIDIGGTKIALALCTTGGEIISRRRFPTRTEIGPGRILERVFQEIEGMLCETRAELAGAGIGCAGPLDLERGLVMSPPNLPGWHQFPLALLVRERLRVPVLLDNDANAAALGEHERGAGRGLHDMVYLTISTGIGGGVIIGGKLIRGIAGGAGEVGHLTVLASGPECGCGSRGCLETLCSGTAIARRARERIAQGASSLISSMVKDPSEVTAQTVAVAAQRGDTLAREVWDEAVYYLSIGVGNIISVLAPEAIIIGGGVSSSGEQLLGPLRLMVAERVRMLPVEKIRIVRAALGEDSGLHGALALGRRTVRSQKSGVWSLES